LAERSPHPTIVTGTAMAILHPPTASGILFNHESPLRPARFVTQKVIRAAADVAVNRRKEPSPWAISTSGAIGAGPRSTSRRCTSLYDTIVRRTSLSQRARASHRAFLAEAFAAFGLDWQAHVVSSAEFIRPSNISVSTGCPARAHGISRMESASADARSRAVPRKRGGS
jgi:GDPmannose 4,6-dehydratase